jgi:hypothetical protein
MKSQGSNLNKPGSKYSLSLAPILYNEVLFKMGATDLSSYIAAPSQILAIKINF